MARAHSLGLRKRVVGAVMAGELSRREAASRFGAAASTAVKWVDRYRVTRSAAPGKMGGHKPKEITGGGAELLRHHRRERASTLRGLARELADERALRVDYRSVWESIRAEKLTYKKRGRSQMSAITATSPGGGHTGSSISLVSIHPAWCSLMRPGPRPTWRHSAAGRGVASGSR